MYHDGYGTTGGKVNPLQWAAANAPTVFLAFDAPLIGVLMRWPNRLHAVTLEGVVDGVLGPRLFVAACGAKGLRLWAGPMEGTAALWPPRVKGMPEPFIRCQECYVATGRKRPRSEWKGG